MLRFRAAISCLFIEIFLAISGFEDIIAFSEVVSMWDGIDKRRFPRAVYKCTISIRRLNTPEEIYTHTENIGVGGICVFLEKNLKIFEEVGLELALEDGAQPIECHGKIVWHVARKDLREKKHIFDTGIEFIGLSDKDKQRIEMIVEEILSRQKIISQ